VGEDKGEGVMEVSWLATGSGIFLLPYQLIPAGG
jgi:hypothetical protein